jgi:hypothetical protein
MAGIASGPYPFDLSTDLCFSTLARGFVERDGFAQ